MRGKWYSLEEVRVVMEAEEGNCIGEHPYVAATTVVVRFAPLAVLVPHTQDLVRDPFRVSSLVVSVGVVACNTKPSLLKHKCKCAQRHITTST